jgi:type II secretory pathway pseudopilin PulG
MMVAMVGACMMMAGSSFEKDGLTLPTLLEELDRTVAQSGEYDAVKLQRVDSLRQLSRVAGLSVDERYRLNHLIFEEYEYMTCDSALHYLEICSGLAKKSGRSEDVICSRIDEAAVLSKAGLFNESLEILKSIDPATIPYTLLDEYYLTARDTYQYLQEFVEGTKYSDIYRTLTNQYNDSIIKYAPKGSYMEAIGRGDSYLYNGHFREAYDYLTAHLSAYATGDRSFSVISSMIAYAAHRMGNKEMAAKYYALSAISDVQGSVKENMAMRSLAEHLYETKDIGRANRYIQKSIEDANYYSARMRKSQSTRMLPLVDNAYKMLEDEVKSKMRISIIAISILAVLLLLAIIYIFRQLNAVRRSHRRVSEARDELSQLNEELQDANRKLKDTNTQLSEANCIKEEYLGRFIHLTSKSIAMLETYQKTLYKLGKAHKMEQLYEKLSSTEIIDDTLEKFYTAFDHAFLNIFPDFVKRFNDLLTEENRITLRDSKSLNTELRVFALIRLGISDSSMIAEFLRCSISTIYTYRSKMKNRSTLGAGFEAAVMSIDAFGADALRTN